MSSEWCVGLSVFIIVVLGSRAYSFNNTQPLILTPYLKNGNVQEAQMLSATNFNNRSSYTGYFTTHENCGNNLFFWFFPAEENWLTAPVLVWLNGGPGASSLYGLFTEIGPWNYQESKGLVNNSYTWTKDHNVVFFDQPVGTGFSFSEKECYATNITKVSEQMYSALTQFFTMFPAIQGNKLFLTGESYAGHYIPALAMEIDRRNVQPDVKLNLIGILVGNAWLDIRCNNPSNLLFELGIIDQRHYKELKLIHEHIIQEIDNKNYMQSLDLFFKSRHNFELPSYYNILYDNSTDQEINSFSLLFKETKLQNYIHVGNTEFKLLNQLVLYYLWREVLGSQRSSLEYLLRTGKYIVGFYTGQLDTICSVRSVSCVLESLEWPGSAEFLNTTRGMWYVSGRLAGWVKVAGNLLEVVVRGAGHLVPKDQGEAALDLIKAVVSSEPGDETLFHKLTNSTS